MNQHDYSTYTSEEAAFAAENLNYSDIDHMVSNIPEKFRDFMKSTLEKVVITSAINGPNTPHGTNPNKERWIPIYNIEGKKEGSGGVALSLRVCSFDNSYALVGARLAFDSKEGSAFYAENFKHVDEKYMA